MSSQPKQINKQDVVFTQLEDEAVILNLRTKYYFTVNETGSRVWELLEQGQSPEAIVQTIADEYEVAPEECAADVNDLIGKFEREGLLL